MLCFKIFQFGIFFLSVLVLIAEKSESFPMSAMSPAETPPVDMSLPQDHDPFAAGMTTTYPEMSTISSHGPRRRRIKLEQPETTEPTIQQEPMQTYARGNFNTHVEHEDSFEFPPFEDTRAMGQWDTVHETHTDEVRTIDHPPVKHKKRVHHEEPNAIIDVFLPDIPLVGDLLAGPLDIVEKSPVNDLAGGLLSDIG